MRVVLGRLLLAAAFIRLGLDAARAPGATARLVRGAGIPYADLAVRLNGTSMVAAGTALALGILPRWAARLLIVTLIPTTLIGHPFWEHEPGEHRAAQRIQFFKNLSMLGGLLLAGRR